jgi:phosphoglycolate phosphatase
VIRVHELRVDAGVVVFDKDGTLLQIDPLWTDLVRDWLTGIIRRVDRPDLLGELRSAIAVADDGRLVPNGIAHAGTMDEAVEAVAATLYRHGVGDAESHVLAAGADIGEPDPADIVPVGDVAGTMTRLKNAGVALVVATSDERRSTEAHLELLGVNELVNLVVCADDDLASKPSPEVLGRVGDGLGVAAERIVMVGDSEVDMLTGRNGGAAACIGVTGGGGDPVGADVCVETIEQICLG